MIDDDVFVRRTLQRNFSQMCDVITVPDGEGALALLDSGERFGVILCDHRLGTGMCGREVYDRIHRACPEQALRMIMMSGFAPGGRDATFAEALGRRWLEKPFSHRDLVVAVSLMMARRYEG